MGLFKPTPEEKAAIQRMKDADRALHENSERERRAGIDYETPEYQRLNAAANEAAAKVPFRFGGPRKSR
ncbi:hypothetical protein [Streptomyces sp. DH37]|uniref:hypothetical protein n=1 Tax=Streptomyces sp. DH37 TaxID=3040122 RepID=UPI002442D423|nr:hypothetical protein [Streptomyces sp. DH37]MDG9701685.1 hypothetical protein [Streptomyces sp. DH37]